MDRLHTIDTDRVVAWSDSPDRYQSLTTLVDSWAEQNLEVAGVLIEELVSRDMPPDISSIDHYIMRRFQQNPDEMNSWAAGLSQKLLKDHVIQVWDQLKKSMRPNKTQNDIVFAANAISSCVHEFFYCLCRQRA